MNQADNRAEKRIRWQSVLAKSKLYPGSIPEFCRQEGVSIYTFRYWHRKLNQDNEQKLIGTSAFARVQIQTSLADSNHHQDLPDPRWIAEILLHLQRGMR